jgi:hypothetical protein
VGFRKCGGVEISPTKRSVNPHCILQTQTRAASYLTACGEVGAPLRVGFRKFGGVEISPTKRSVNPHCILQTQTCAASHLTACGEVGAPLRVGFRKCGGVYLCRSSFRRLRLAIIPEGPRSRFLKTTFLVSRFPIATTTASTLSRTSSLQNLNTFQPRFSR